MGDGFILKPSPLEAKLLGELMQFIQIVTVG